MFGKLLIFVSSTSDLAAERKALKELFGQYGGIYEAYFYEDDTARSESPEERCRAVIERANVFVSILGTKYGSPYPPPGNAGSIVEWELETARASPERRLIAVVIKKLSGGEQIDPPQEKLIRSVRGWRGLWCREYESPGELTREVLRSLVQWSGEITLRTLGDEQDSKRRRRRFLIPVAVASVLLVGALYALNLGLGLDISNAKLVAACALECVLLLAILILIL
jgi:hypothetical protein